MNKAFLALCALLVAGLLTACNQLTQYTISEQEVNRALQKHNNYEKYRRLRAGQCAYRTDQPQQPDWPRRAGQGDALRQREGQHHFTARSAAGGYAAEDESAAVFR